MNYITPQKLIIKSMGKDFLVTGIFDNIKDTNLFCEKTNHGVIACVGKLNFVAELNEYKDISIKPSLVN